MWLIYGLLSKTRDLKGDAIELGAYEGGCSYYSALFMALTGDKRRYILLDSFEGFKEMSRYDPIELKDRFKDASYDRVYQRFVDMKNTQIVKGFIPDILTLFSDEHYSFVYYDCDLYDLAMASLKHFLPKLPEGGVFLIDDYCVTKDFLGTRKAVEVFSKLHNINVIEIPESTHGLIIKGGWKC
jgi:hypothetical protein